MLAVAREFDNRRKRKKLQERLDRRERTWEDDDLPTEEFTDWEVVPDEPKVTSSTRRSPTEVFDFDKGDLKVRYRKYD